MTTVHEGVLGSSMPAIGCPSCGVELARAPTRRVLCHACGQPILVRKGHLFTEDEARAVDICRRAAIPLDKLWAARAALSREGSLKADDGDAAWRVLNEAVAAAPDHYSRRMLYFLMARFAWVRGGDHVTSARLSHQMQLDEWKTAADSGLVDLSRARIEVVTARESSCLQCRRLEGVSFTYAECVIKQPLPATDCTYDRDSRHVHGWCRCVYGLHPLTGRG